MRPAADQLLVDLVGPVELIVDVGDGLLSVLLVLDGVDAAAGPAVQSVLKLCVLAEAAGVAEEGVLFVVVDASALVTLEHVLTTVATDSRVGRD